MLVICNGAYKSGSTWLFRIVQEMTRYALPPERYARPGWSGTGVSPHLLKAFLDEVDYAGRDYVFKAHIFYKHHLVARRPHVTVLNITRDIRDVVVSAFHYERMKGHYAGDDFASYYRTRGREVVRMVARYNRLWAATTDTFTANYERLHDSFAEETAKIAEFLNVTLKDDDVERIHAATALDQMRERYNEVSPDGQMQFYRKGETGDWRNHFDDALSADAQQLERTAGLHFPTLLHLALNRARCVFRGREIE
jgi:hypothetical protein